MDARSDKQIDSFLESSGARFIDSNLKILKVNKIISIKDNLPSNHSIQGFDAIKNKN